MYRQYNKKSDYKKLRGYIFWCEYFRDYDGAFVYHMRNDGSTVYGITLDKDTDVLVEKDCLKKIIKCAKVEVWFANVSRIAHRIITRKYQEQFVIY